MKIEKYVVGMIGTNCYLVINEETKDTVMVDPGSYPAKLKNAVKEQGLKLKAVLLTHAHFDHIMGIDDFKKVYTLFSVYPYFGHIFLLKYNYKFYRCDGRYKSSSICGRSRSTDDDGR